jgi:hypothetical protein
MSLFDSLFTNSDAQDAANAKSAGLTAGYNQASGLYDQGRNALTTNYTAGLQPQQQLFGQAQGGINAYGDATGANGSSGYANATKNFQASPGYQFSFNQGLQALDRGAASKGMLTSGNTLNAEQQFGTGLANQNYQQYVTNLQPYLGLGQSSANAIGTLDANLGNSLNSSYGNQGNLAFNTQAGIGNAQGAADLANGAAANNAFSAIGAGLNLGTKLLGFA